MSGIDVGVGFELPWQPGPIQTLVDKRLPSHGIAEPVALQTVWDASFYGLDRVGAFADLDADTQAAVLADCSRGSLLEAYFIEKAGVSYAAKMTLLAQSADERSLYALFCAEEAAHLDAIGAALGPVEEQGWRANPFLALLQQIIEQGDRRTGQLIIQVVLEGWGLLHYGSLRDACHDPGLRGLLARIVADEAGHHGSGVHLLRQEQFDARTQDDAVDLLGQMLAMVQVGPAMVAGTLEQHCGGFTTGQRHQVYAELDAEGHVRDRLGKLKACLDKVPGARPITERLVQDGRFAIPTLESLV